MTSILLTVALAVAAIAFLVASARGGSPTTKRSLAGVITALGGLSIAIRSGGGSRMMGILFLAMGLGVLLRPLLDRKSPRT